MGVVIPLLAESSENELRDLLATWSNFRARECECSDPQDKERMLSVIVNGLGGLGGFNTMVSDLLTGVGKQMRYVSSVEHVTASGELRASGIATVSAATLDLFRKSSKKVPQRLGASSSLSSSSSSFEHIAGRQTSNGAQIVGVSVEE